MLAALKNHWSEYLIEAFGLGIFMLSASVFGVLLEHPSSLLRQTITDAFARRVLMGVAMGLTAISLVYSPWGQRSGAHLNPALTFTFFRLGKVARPDAIFYAVAQFAGGSLGALIAAFLLGSWLSHPSVNFVATVPGTAGIFPAFGAEVFITFGLMYTVLTISNHARLSRFTGLFAGALVAIYIAFEAPVSGMSLNPARTFASAFSGNIWTAIWIYFTAPPIGMLLAAEAYVRGAGTRKIFCAKLHHHHDKRCIFRCNFAEMNERNDTFFTSKLGEKTL